MARIQHMVLLKFKPEITGAQVDALMATVRRLGELVPGIEYLAGGPYSSPEGFHQGFTHGFLVTFRDSAARNGYLDHPEHVKVRDALLAAIENGIAFDFEE